LDEPIAGSERLAAIQKYCGDIGLGAKPLISLRQHIHVASRQDKALVGELDRRRDEHIAPQGSVFFPRRLQPHDRSRNAHRQIAIEAAVGNDPALSIQKHVRTRSERRFLAEVEKRIPAVGQVDDHEATAAQITATRMRYGERIAHGDRRIDRVPTLPQYCGADIGRVVLRGHDHALGGFGFQRRSGMS
jgi:hypothetical protein